MAEFYLGNIKGKQGPKGDNGHTPQKGVDYWTEDDKKEIKEELKQEIDIPEFAIEINGDTAGALAGVTFDAENREEFDYSSNKSFDGTDAAIVDFRAVIEIDGEEKTIMKDTEGLASFSISFQYGDDGHGMPLYIDYTSLPQQLEPYDNYFLVLMRIVYNGVEYYPDSLKSVVLVLERTEEDKLVTKNEVLALIEENIPPSGDEVSY